MKEHFKVWFEVVAKWAIKHWDFFKWVLTVVATLVAVFIWPLLLIKVTLPIWKLILIVILPFVFYYSLGKYFREKRIPKKFNAGDRVYLKDTYKLLFVLTYDWLSHTIVRCSDETGKQFTFHQDSLTNQDNQESHSALFLSSRRNDSNRY